MSRNQVFGGYFFLEVPDISLITRGWGLDLLKGDILWMDEIHVAPPFRNPDQPLFVGIYRGRIIFRFLKVVRKPGMVIPL